MVPKHVGELPQSGPTNIGFGIVMICPDSMTWDVKGSIPTGWWSQNWLNRCRKWIYRTSKIKVFGEFGWICFKSIEVKSKSLVIVRELDPYIQVAKVDFQSSRTVRSLGVESDSLDFFKEVFLYWQTILCAFWRQVSVFLGNITTWLRNMYHCLTGRLCFLCGLSHLTCIFGMGCNHQSV